MNTVYIGGVQEWQWIINHFGLESVSLLLSTKTVSFVNDEDLTVFKLKFPGYKQNECYFLSQRSLDVFYAPYIPLMKTLN